MVIATYSVEPIYNFCFKNFIHKVDCLEYCLSFFKDFNLAIQNLSEMLFHSQQSSTLKQG